MDYTDSFYFLVLSENNQAILLIKLLCNIENIQKTTLWSDFGYNTYSTFAIFFQMAPKATDFNTSNKYSSGMIYAIVKNNKLVQFISSPFANFDCKHVNILQVKIKRQVSVSYFLSTSVVEIIFLIVNWWLNLFQMSFVLINKGYYGEWHFVLQWFCT